MMKSEAVRNAEAFDEGMRLGTRVEHRVAVQAIVTALLEVMGKDPGDGPINLGAAGTWFAGSGEHHLAELVTTEQMQARGQAVHDALAAYGKGSE